MKHIHTFISVLIVCLGIGLVGCTDQWRTTQTYTIRGDVSAISPTARVYVQHRFYDSDGNREEAIIAETSTTDGWVELSGDVSEPTVVRIVTEVDGQTKDVVPTVVEPGGDITLIHFGPMIGMYSIGSGKHQQLVNSWGLSERYANARNAYAHVMVQKQAIEEQIEALQNEDATAVAQTAEIVVSSESPGSEQPADSQPVEGDTVEPRLTLEELEARKQELLDQAVEIYQELDAAKRVVLDEIAMDEDAALALLAMELGGMGNTAEAVQRLDVLAEQLSEEVVAVRITPRRASLVSYLERMANNEGLVVGDNAPDFTALQLDGAEVNLYNTIASKDIVLIDFWASWCGPCIKSFPKLKELYSEHSQAGFGVVSVSIDDTEEDWQEAADEHLLPWIDLGDISTSTGPIAQEYGVTFIPKKYVVDATGKIVGKDLNEEDLEKLILETVGSDS